MKRVVTGATLALAVFAGVTWAADEKGKQPTNVYSPDDGKSFDITDKDVVRFTGPSPGSTGIKTAVKVIEGDAKVVERANYGVAKGVVVKIGGGAVEFDVVPTAGKKGKIKVAVTTTPPGGKEEKKEYEFVVK